MISFFWDVMPYNLIDRYQHFAGNCCLHLQRSILKMEAAILRNFDIYLLNDMASHSNLQDSVWYYECESCVVAELTYSVKILPIESNKASQIICATQRMKNTTILKVQFLIPKFISIHY
jgi:hypothetical protein